MAYSKREFITSAMKEIGILGAEFDPKPEELRDCLERLDNMIAEWNGEGVRMNYPLPWSPGDSNIDEKTGIPDWANGAVISNLAVRISPMFGITPSQVTLATAKKGFVVVLARLVEIPKLGLRPILIAGAGNRRGGVFIPTPRPQVRAGPDGDLDCL